MKKIMKILLTLTAFTPLIMFKNTFFPYVFGESFYLRVILVLLGVLFIYSFIFYKDFRNEILNKLNLVLRNKIFISLIVFIFLLIVSTVFAIDKTSAFWGTLDRMEGLSAFLYFFLLFIFSILIFENKDWLNFFKIILFITLVLFIKEVIQFMGGVARPQSFVDNPIFLAGYFLFSITSALIVFQYSSFFWKYFSSTIIIFSFIGIFLTQTRGSILGLFVGLVASLFYTLIKTYKSKDKILKRYKILSSVSLILIILFSLTFVLTKENTFWQKVPGLSRVAHISTEDDTTNTRLLMTKVSLDAINPKINGIKKFLLGWGPENFSIAYGSYFDPKQFDFEMVWFDRPHNKIFDLFVSLGIFGLLSYIILYFYFIKSAFKDRQFNFKNVAILFFSIAFLIHLFFVFDQITTSIPFFLLLGYIVYDNTLFENKEKVNIISNRWKNIFVGLVFMLALITMFIFLKDTLPSYLKSKKYIICSRHDDTECIYKNIDYFLDKNITARNRIMIKILDDYKDKNKDKYKIETIKYTLKKGEDIVKYSPYNFKLIINMATIYSAIGKDLKSDYYLKKGEGHMRYLQDFSSDRPDLNLGLAINLYYQDKYTESLIYLNKVMLVSSTYYTKNQKEINSMYMNILKYFYEEKDKDNFVKLLESISKNGYNGDIPSKAMLDFVEKYKTIPSIDFE
ncbi:TPA: O-antigen ligase family protein [Candidatus Nomurabacteria bacterium]|nr:MAG: hypothetical protein O210_OD1C00001G0719 [Parcubacteria bacterium RAAC4_OD1_1]HCY26065.1 O-antigen ligase family protein [Candidatus Nomurabacteria bacterium]